MNISEFLRANLQNDDRFARFDQFDPEHTDYTLQIQKPTGELVTLRNPSEAADGTLTDKGYSVTPGSKLVAFGTAFWEWTAKKQHTIGVDIDTNDNHADGLSAGQIGAALEAVHRVTWLEARRSSGGKGLHVFPKFTQPVDVSTRAEASALARAVLTLASREANFDFKAVKDCAGGNMWIFKNDAGSNAYEVIKEATSALNPSNLPPGWREAKEASNHKVRFAPSTVALSPEHLAIEKQIQDTGYSMIYRHDIGCYHVHTYALQLAHKQHAYRGHFATASGGNDPGQPNAFMFPLPSGVFLVKRFGNAKEDKSWFDSPNGPYAFLNVEVPFDKAIQHFAMNKTTKGFAFETTNLEAMLNATGIKLELPIVFAGRTLFVKITKGMGQIVVEKHDLDQQIKEWTATGTTWQRSFTVPTTPEAFAHAEVLRVSDVVRAVTTDTESAKWCIKTDGEWIGTSASEVSNVLTSQRVAPASAMGRMRQEPWWLVFEPFQDEYLSGRRWNREAPQLACPPADVAGPTPTWDAIFGHIGSGLDEDIVGDDDCKRRGITSGAQYLMLWTKLLIEKPEQRTPYLFLTSRQNNTGKTSLGASMSYLINPGVAEINSEALVDKFTGEFEGKVLCLIEELDLRDERKKAYAMLKRVLTSKTLTIRRMRTDAYNVPNFTHFLHTANDAKFVPVETEDMRVVMITVPQITQFIESGVFDEGVKREAPSMLRKLLDMPLPDPCGRFWLPVVQTSLKESVLSGVYDDEVSEAEEGLKKFAFACIAEDKNGYVPTSVVLSRYAEYCKSENIPSVPKAGFLSSLKEKVLVSAGKKQKRIEGQRVWHYTGFSLKGAIAISA
jgi:hypothetical protein